MRFILRHCGVFRGHVPIPPGLGTPCGKVSPHVPDASFLMIRAPFLRPCYEAVPFFNGLTLFFLTLLGRLDAVEKGRHPVFRNLAAETGFKTR